MTAIAADVQEAARNDRTRFDVRSDRSRCNVIELIKQCQKCTVTVAGRLCMFFLSPLKQSRAAKAWDCGAFTVHDWFSRESQTHEDDERRSDALSELLYWLPPIIPSAAVILNGKWSVDARWGGFHIFTSQEWDNKVTTSMPGASCLGQACLIVQVFFSSWPEVNHIV